MSAWSGPGSRQLRPAQRRRLGRRGRRTRRPEAAECAPGGTGAHARLSAVTLSASADLIPARAMPLFSQS